MNSITVIGAGYVGLVTAAGFAHLGHDVTCVDIDADKIKVLNDGGIPIYEAGLEDLVKRGVQSGLLRFQVGHNAKSLKSDFYYLCVPTPQSVDGSADLTYLEAAVREIGPELPNGCVVVNKSTVPVGSARFVEQTIGRSNVHVVSNPEFLREGTAVHDFMNPDRIVIGSEDQAAAVRVAGLYLALGSNILVTDQASAELIKYASNAFLAMKLSFINSVAAVCEGVGADVADVRLGMGYDKRIGLDFLQPGPGWGGSCFPKDSQAMIRIADDAGFDMALLQAAVDANDGQFDRVADKIRTAADGCLSGKKVGMLGLAFKAGTDDIRMSPALAVAERLIEEGAIVQAFDPAASVDIDGIVQVDDAYAACEAADVVAVLTEWPDFKWLDYEKVSQLMAGDTVVDTRATLERGALRRAGLELVSIGRS